jgi:hypothetical protein
MSLRLGIAFFSALAVCAAGPLHGFSVESVKERVYTEQQMTSLSEYLTGRESYGRRTYLRTDAGHRGGHYMVADLDAALSTLPSDTVVVLDIARACDGQYKTFTLPLSAAKGVKGKSLYLGLTGPDDAGGRILAWKLAFQDAKGVVIAEKTSFLWSMPKK